MINIIASIIFDITVLSLFFMSFDWSLRILKSTLDIFIAESNSSISDAIFIASPFAFCDIANIIELLPFILARVEDFSYVFLIVAISLINIFLLSIFKG